MSNKNTKNILPTILIPLTVVLIIVGCFFLSNGGEREVSIIDIDYDKYFEILKGEELSYILISRPNCSHCLTFKPKINKIAKEYGFKVYNFCPDDLDKEKWDKVHSSVPSLDAMTDEESGPYIGTPHSIIVQNGKEIDNLSGDRDSKSIIDFLKGLDFIK